MQVFRAYLHDAAGAVTWAAWIEADTATQARALAGPLCDGAAPVIDLWWASPRENAHVGALQAV